MPKEVRTYRLTEFSRWNPKTMPFDCSSLVVGSTGFGKSFLMVHLLRQLNVQRIIALVLGQECYKMWPKHIHPLYLYDQFDKKWKTAVNTLRAENGLVGDRIEREMEEIVKNEEKKAKLEDAREWNAGIDALKAKAAKYQWTVEEAELHLKKMEKEHKRLKQQRAEARSLEYEAKSREKREPYVAYVLADDVENEGWCLKDDFWSSSLKAGRHATLSQWTLFQDLLKVPSGNRGQYRYLILSPKLSKSRVVSLVQWWLPANTMVHPVMEMQNILAAFAAREKTWLVINRGETSSDITKIISRYTVPRLENLYDTRIGSVESHFVGDLYFDEVAYEKSKSQGEIRMQEAEVRTRSKRKTKKLAEESSEDDEPAQATTDA